MLKNIKFVLLLLLILKTREFNTPMANISGMSNMNSYNNFWDGALGGRGYWGRTPHTGTNVFNSKFDNSGYKSVYNLNSLSPFSQIQNQGYESMVPYFTPYGSSRYTFFPTKSNYHSNDQLGSFAYDINEPRYAELYKQYYKFFNMNLDRLSVLQKYTNLNHDLNKDDFRKVSNPNSFQYDKYFDGFNEHNTQVGSNLPIIKFKADKGDRLLRQNYHKKNSFKNLEKKIVDKEFSMYKDNSDSQRVQRKIEKFEKQLEQIETDIVKDSAPEKLMKNKKRRNKKRWNKQRNLNEII